MVPYFLFAGSRACRFETACDNAERDDGERREEDQAEDVLHKARDGTGFPYLNRP
jgi:hypothetical protein